MAISSKIDRSNSLTTFILKGDISADDILLAQKTLYENPDQPPTLNVLWDIQEAIVTPPIKDEDLNRIVSYLSINADSRKGGKTAIVARVNFDFNVSKKYELFTQLKGLAVTVAVFRSLGEATMWLEE